MCVCEYVPRLGPSVTAFVCSSSSSSRANPCPVPRRKDGICLLMIECCRAIFYGNEMGVSLLQCIRGWDWDGWDGEFHDTCTLLKVLMLRRRLT